MYAGCSDSTQVVAFNIRHGVGNAMLFGIDPWNWFLCSLESDSLPGMWFLCSLEFDSLPWKCCLCSLESAYPFISEVAIKQERGRAEKRPSERIMALERIKKRERVSSSEKSDEEGSESSKDGRIDSKDVKRNSKDVKRSSKDTKHAKEPKPVKNAGEKRRGAEEAEHGKASKKNRRVEEDDEEDETPKKSKGGKAAVITPDKQEGARCMQCWVVCRLWIFGNRCG